MTRLIVTRIALLMLAFFAGQNGPKGQAAAPTKLQEARESFTFSGKRIHPAVLDHFVPPMIGAGPEVLAVDVEAAMQRAAHLPPAVADQWRPGYLTYRYQEDELLALSSYSVAGSLDDGTIVVRSITNRGGSYMSLNLLLLRLEQVPVFPEQVPQLVLRLVKILPLPHVDATVEASRTRLHVRHVDQHGKVYEKSWSFAE